MIQKQSFQEFRKEAILLAGAISGTVESIISKIYRNALDFLAGIGQVWE